MTSKNKPFQLPKSRSDSLRIQMSEAKYARNRANRKRKQANRRRNIGGQFRNAGSRKGQG